MSSRRGTSLADSDTILTIRVAWKVVTPEVCYGIFQISASLDVAGAARPMSGRLITQQRRANFRQVRSKCSTGPGVVGVPSCAPTLFPHGGNQVTAEVLTAICRRTRDPSPWEALPAPSPEGSAHIPRECQRRSSLFGGQPLAGAKCWQPGCRAGRPCAQHYGRRSRRSTTGDAG
jgi:hypothetical protein